MKKLNEIRDFLFKIEEEKGGCKRGQEFLRRNNLTKRDIVKFLFTNKGAEIGVSS